MILVEIISLNLYIKFVTTKKERTEYMRELGRKGGLANVQKNGKKHMSQIAKKMWRGMKKGRKASESN